MIGYYVHHHGSGHRHRFAAVRTALPELVGLGSGAPPSDLPSRQWVALAHDVSQPTPIDPTACGALHWAPLREPGLQVRTAELAAWTREATPAALVVDVSVEIALTARLLSVPTVVVAQHGLRNDDAHRLGYRTAGVVAALWPAGAAPDPPGEVVHVGPISRFDGWSVPLETGRSAASDGPPTALLLCGRGGLDFTTDDVRQAVAATAGAWRWIVVGMAAPGGSADDDLAGVHWRPQLAAAEIWRALHAADVVVAPASNNCVAETAAARRPLIALPQDRPFGEQHAHAAILAERELATVAEQWPAPDRWPALLETAATSRADWAGYHDGRGAQRLAALAQEVAAV